MKPTSPASKMAYATVGALALYFLAYALLLHPILAGPPGGLRRITSYINPVTCCEAPSDTKLRYFFWPAHQLDRLLRPGFWSPT